MAKTLEFLEQFRRVLTPARCTTGPLEEQKKNKKQKTMHMSCMNRQWGTKLFTSGARNMENGKQQHLGTCAHAILFCAGAFLLI